MSFPRVTAFGFAQADFVTPGAVPVYSRIYGVKTADIKYESEREKIDGDDDIIAIWNHSPSCAITIKGAVIDYEVYQKITGVAPVEEDPGPPRVVSILRGTDTEMDGAEFMLRLKQRARDIGNSSGHDRYLYLFRCFGTIDAGGLEKGKAVEVTISAELIKAETDEYGDALAESAFYKEKLVEN